MKIDVRTPWKRNLRAAKRDPDGPDAVSPLPARCYVLDGQPLDWHIYFEHAPYWKDNPNYTPDLPQDHPHYEPRRLPVLYTKGLPRWTACHLVVVQSVYTPDATIEDKTLNDDLSDVRVDVERNTILRVSRKAFCSPDDNFSRFMGRMLSFERMLEAIRTGDAFRGVALHETLYEVLSPSHQTKWDDPAGDTFDESHYAFRTSNRLDLLRLVMRAAADSPDEAMRHALAGNNFFDTGTITLKGVLGEQMLAAHRKGVDEAALAAESQIVDGQQRDEFPLADELPEGPMFYLSRACRSVVAISIDGVDMPLEPWRIDPMTRQKLYTDPRTETAALLTESAGKTLAVVYNYMNLPTVPTVPNHADEFTLIAGHGAGKSIFALTARCESLHSVTVGDTPVPITDWTLDAHTRRSVYVMEGSESADIMAESIGQMLCIRYKSRDVRGEPLH